MQIAARIDVLNADEMARIKEAMLGMLSEVGIWIECPEAVAMMERHGYRMDGHRLKPTPDETQAFINNYAHAPLREASRPQGEIDRGRNEVVPGRKQFSIGTVNVCIFDYDTQRVRRGNLGDSRKAALFANGLECIGSVNPVVVPAEVHPELALLAAQVEVCKFSRKAGAFNPGPHLTPRNLPFWEEMGYLAAGGRESCEKHPVLGLAGFDMSSPMRLSKFCTDRTRISMKFRKLGGSVSSLPLQGLNAMVTVAGGVAQSLAEVLGGGMFLEMIEKEMTGATHYAFRFAPGFVPVDMRCARKACSGVENTLAHIALSQMTEFLGLPVSRRNYGSGKTEAKLWGVQSGSERTLNTVFPLLAGLGWGPSVGDMFSEEYFSFEQAIMDLDLYGMANRIIEGVRVDGDALNLGVFKEGIAAGLFTGLEHTAANFRTEMYLPQLASRESYAQWDDEGRKTLEEKAHERVVEILARAEPDPKYPPEVLREMERLLERFKEAFA
ncbi:MAG: trimethylamine methyltransferase family protein [Armatimonadetes bacterium]|nr:trimethylamine methyltransferase family protein [Armatimonadota bacterium]